MRLIDILNSPWAIVPDKLAELTEIYSTHLRGEKIDIASVEARLGRPLANEQKPYEVTAGGVALLPMVGVIAKRMNLFSEISGGVSTQLMGRDLQQARADRDVRSIMLLVDSPGGTVDGTQELARLIAEVNEEKPVVAVASGWMTSGAYWIGSAADSAWIEDDTTMTGSIGVAMQHTDYSEAYKQRGIVVTDIFAGKYKRIATQAAPLSGEGRQVLQDQVDYVYSIFVEAVAAQRGVPVKAVLDGMADGRLFTGKQGIDAGLVDGQASASQIIAQLSDGTYQRRRTKQTGRGAGVAIAPDVTGAGVASNPTTKPEGEHMAITKDQVVAEAPDVANALRAEGAAQELARIQGVEAQSMPGHEQLIAQMKFDGKTTGAEAAVKVLAAEKQKLGNKNTQLNTDAPAALPPTMAPEPGADEKAKREAEAKLPFNERCKAQWDRDANLRAEFDGSFDRFVAFEKANEAGNVRIFGGKKKAA